MMVQDDSQRAAKPCGNQEQNRGHRPKQAGRSQSTENFEYEEHSLQRGMEGRASSDGWATRMGTLLWWYGMIQYLDLCKCFVLDKPRTRMPNACLDSWKCRSKFVLLLDQMDDLITLISNGRCLPVHICMALANLTPVFYLPLTHEACIANWGPAFRSRISAAPRMREKNVSSQKSEQAREPAEVVGTKKQA